MKTDPICPQAETRKDNRQHPVWHGGNRSESDAHRDDLLSPPRDEHLRAEVVEHVAAAVARSGAFEANNGMVTAPRERPT